MPPRAALHETMDIGDERRSMRGGDPMLDLLFDRYVLPGVIDSAFVAPD